MITAAGAGSGLDIESIVAQLMTIEAQPIQELRQNRSRVDVEISDYAKLKSALSDLQQAAQKLADPGEFGAFTALSSNEDTLQVETLDGVIEHSHDIEVLSLAQPHRLVSDSFTDASSSVGAGDYAFSSGDESFTISLAGGADGLVDLIDAINNSADNTTMSASLVNVDGGARMILTSLGGGTSNTITAPPMFTELNPATDASFTIDGLAVTAADNTNSTVVPGLSIHLRETGRATISSERNTESIQKILQEFADKHNSLQDVMEELSQSSMQSGTLNRRIEGSLRTQFFTEITLPSGAAGSIFELGLSFDKEGKLSVDEQRMNAAIAANPKQVLELFTDAEKGFASLIDNALQDYVTTGGTLDLRRDTLNSRVDNIDDQILRYEIRLERTEERLRRQFGAMDSMISRLQNNGNYLLQQLGSLPNNQ